jgi:hypothetical protein
MTKHTILELYRQGRNHLDIASMYYALRKAVNAKYEYQQAEKEVIETILMANKRPQ